MPIRPRIPRAFRLAPSRDDVLAAQVDEEIRLHLELRAEQLVRRGLTPEAARREAERRFGGVPEARRALQRTAIHREERVRMRAYAEGVLDDLRHALRSFVRERGFAAVVVLTLALGVGANAAMFGVLDRLLLSGPAHVRDADALGRLYVSTTPPGEPERALSTFGYVSLAALREARTLTGLAAYTGVQDEPLGRGLDAERVRVRYVTANLFPLLGTRPALGRFFDAADERPPAGEPVVVLDHATWRRRFGGDSAVIGRPLRLGERTFTVIGVAPPGFTGPELEPVDLWLPVSASTPLPDWPTTRGMTWLRVVGRLAPGATPEQATAEVTRLYRAEPVERQRAEHVRVAFRPLWFDAHGVEAKEVAVSRWLIGVSAVLLLVACANVANLLLARGIRRRREIAVRLALGVSRRRLVRLLFLEGAVLAVAGGLAGVAVAYWGVQLLRLTLLEGIAWDRPPIDARVLAVTAATVVATALLVALLPALKASDPRLARTLTSGTAQAGQRRSRLRDALTLVQAALSAALLVGAGLFVHSLQRAQRLDIGIAPANVLEVVLSWPDAPGLSEADEARESARRRQVRERALERLRALPGVEHAASGMGTPFTGAWWAYPRVPGYDSLPPMPGGGPYFAIVSADYLATLGTPILQGRAITAADVRGTERVAVINEPMARTLWPKGDAVGACVYATERDTTCVRVVGVVPHAPRLELRDEPAFQLYYAAGQRSGGVGALFVRTTGEPSALVPTVRRLLQEIDPTLTFADVRRFEDRLAPQLRPWRLGAMVFALFGLLALVVAGVGLYSVMAYATASRARELGVRLALGAQPRDVRRLVLRQGMLLGAGGVAAGVLLALAAGRWVAPLLFDTSPREPLVFAAVLGALLAVTGAASLGPAWRASRTPPSAALRSE